MDFTKVIAQRRSVRKYKKDPLPERKLRRLYEALRLAPSGGNRQNHCFIFVKDEAKRLQIATQACHQEFVAQAPILMAACCEPGGSFDVAIAVDHMILAAANAGLGTCWVGWFERDIVKRILGVPDSKEVPILVAIGSADEEPPARPRKPLEDLIMTDRYVTPGT
jgi:nitroreductase